MNNEMNNEKTSEAIEDYNISLTLKMKEQQLIPINSFHCKIFTYDNLYIKIRFSLVSLL